MPRRPSPQAAGVVSHIKVFERTLWAVRYIIIVPVIAVAAAAIGVVIVTTLEAVQLVGSVQKSFGTGATGPVDRIVPLGNVLQMVEGYLLAAILIIFALGLYELFIARIDAAGASENAPRTLIIQSVDDLKERLGRVVLLALVIEFFSGVSAWIMESRLNSSIWAFGILLIGTALYLSALRSGT
jgi:uncharacterized membrane protein YqhA